MVLGNKTRSPEENKIGMPTFVPWASEMSLRICDSGTEYSYRSRRRCMCFRVVYKPIIICSEICARCLSIGNGQGAYIMVSNMTMYIDWFGDAPKTSRFVR